MIKHIVNHYGKRAQLDICEEECAELIYACSKLKRAYGCGYGTNTEPQEARRKLIKEMAHVLNAIEGLKYILNISSSLLQEEINRSDDDTYKQMDEQGVWRNGKEMWSE